MNLRTLLLTCSTISLIGSQIAHADPAINDADTAAVQNALNGRLSYPHQGAAFADYSAGAIKNTVQKLNSFTFSSLEANPGQEDLPKQESVEGKKIAYFGKLSKTVLKEIRQTVRAQGGKFVNAVQNHKLATAGVVAVITLSGLTYYLYQNGQLYIVGQNAQSLLQKVLSYKKTLIAMGIIAASGTALYFGYKTGSVKLQALDQAKDTITSTISILSIFSKIAALAAKLNSAVGAGKAHVVNAFNTMTSFMQTPVAAPAFSIADKFKTAAIMVRPFAQPLPIVACTGIAAATGYMATKFYKEYKTK